jgi:uncharacterized protein (DUF433 family)
MALTATRYEHIVLDEGGVPRIAGTQLRAIDLVEAKQANAWTAEQLHAQHPELTLGQIYSALAYYWDHQEALDAVIAARRQELAQVKRQTRPSRLVERLRHDGRI